MALKLITAPIIEPVDAAFCRMHMRQSDTSLDALINTYIPASRHEAELYQNRAMLTQTWDLVIDGTFDEWMEIPRPPLQSVTSVTLMLASGSSLVMSLSDFVIDTASEPGRICLADDYYWPADELQEMGGVVIRFTAGYTTANLMPANEKVAVAVGVTHLFDNPAGAGFPDLFYHLLDGRRIVPVGSPMFARKQGDEV